MIPEKTILQIKRHEGFSATPYRCTAEKLTVGYGYNLDAGMSREEATLLLVHRLNILKDALNSKLDYWEDLSEVRQGVLINMAYNLGLNGLRNFVKMFAALNGGDYNTAASEMIDSRWSRQVKGRATELFMDMVNG